MEGNQDESDVEQNESDNDYSSEMLRKKLNTSLDTTGISPVHLHGVAQNSRASTAKNKLDRAVEVLKPSLSDAYVVSTDQLASSESVNVISEFEQKASGLDRLHNLMKEKLTTSTYSKKNTHLDTCTRFIVSSILWITFYCFRTLCENCKGT